MKIAFCVFFIVLLSSLSSFAQSESENKRPYYIEFSAGGRQTYFRDFATSPHIYDGLNAHLGLALSRTDKKRTSSLGVDYSFGQAVMVYNQHFAISNINTISIFCEQLYQIKPLSNSKWNFKTGGMIDFMMNYRVNPALLNNSGGIEFFPSLMGVGEVGFDFSRKETKQFKLWFLKFRLRPRQRQLSFRTNIGLINTTYRNGYVYNGQSALLNEIDFFDGYEWNIFSGIRLGSALDYTFGLRNGNLMKFSYLWNGYTTGGELDRFEMATHTARVSFMFNLSSTQ